MEKDLHFNKKVPFV